jgi:hypothetical protein
LVEETAFAEFINEIATKDNCFESSCALIVLYE